MITPINGTPILATVTVAYVTTDSFDRTILVATTGRRFPVASADKHYLVRGATVNVYDVGLSFFYRVRTA